MNDGDIHKKRKRTEDHHTPSEENISEQGRDGGHEEEQEEDYDESQENNIVMSISHQSGRLGVAYFNQGSGEFGWGETNETGNYNTLEYVKFQINPNVIITPSSTDRTILSALKKSSNAVVGNLPVSKNDVQVKILKSSDFSYNGAKPKLLLLKKVTCDDNTEDQFIEGNYMYGLSTIDCTENKQMVRAAGGLLSYIQGNRLQFGELDEVNVLQGIKAIKTIAFTGYMQLDVNTLNSLAIFKVDHHPCTSMRIGVHKEGLSLFGILNKTRSPPGKDMLRQWFLQPVLDTKVLNERYDTIEYFVKHKDIIDHLRDLVKNCRNTSRIMKRIKESNATVNDWHNLYRTLFCFTQTCIVCFDDELDKRAQSDINLFSKMSELMREEVIGLVQTMSKVIDFRESKEQHRVVIMPGVDTLLDKKKQVHENLDTILTEVAEQITKGLPDGFPELTVCYFPGMGFFIGIPLSILTNRDRPKEVKMVEQYFGDTFAFNSNETAYFDNYVMSAMNGEYGDIHENILVMEKSIMANAYLSFRRYGKQMERYVLEHENLIGRITDVMAELDCLLALSKCACENKYIRPNVTEDSEINIVNGRNPVQEMTVNTFIPNDTKMQLDKGRVNIITGPNNSGKTVYLRQVGLIVFMAHVGSFVPADSCQIGLTDRIMTRMQSQDSISVHQSSFATDLLQIKAMFSDSTERSLLLLDEFGKGTLALDGIALLSSTLDHMIERGTKCPQIFCSTHYTEIFEHKLIDLSNPFVQFWSMQTVVEKQNDHDTTLTMESDIISSISQDIDLSNGDELIFLYKLHKGAVTQSYAHAIAHHAGIPNELLTRAGAVQQKFSKGEVVERMNDKHSRQRMKKCSSIVFQFSRVDIESIQSVLDFVSWVIDIEDDRNPLMEPGESNDKDDDDNDKLSVSSEDLMGPDAGDEIELEHEDS